MDYKTVESQKRIIVDNIQSEGFKGLTYLAGSKKTETLYCVCSNNNEGSEEIVIELGTSAEELTKIRDFLINIVSKIEDNYGIEQSVKILKVND